MTQAENIMAGGFDLDQLDSQTEVLHKVAVITDIDGNDKSGFFIVGKNSPEYQTAARQARVDGLKRSAKRKAALDTSTDEGADAVAKMIEDSETTLACAVVKGWFGFQSAVQTSRSTYQLWLKCSPSFQRGRTRLVLRWRTNQIF